MPLRTGSFSILLIYETTERSAPFYVIVHGGFSGFGQVVNWIAADILRIENGILVEHWDVIQDEAAKEHSKSGNPLDRPRGSRSRNSAGR